MRRLILFLALVGCSDPTAPIPSVRIVTFGDSNVDRGYSGSALVEVSYISPNYGYLPITSTHGTFSLAGKIESHSTDSLEFIAVNHGLEGTTTGDEFRSDGTPHALAKWNGFTRFECEVLGRGAPLWDAGTGKKRYRAYAPRVGDFVFVASGTNDPGFLIDSAGTINNLRQMVKLWKEAGMPPDHFLLANLPPRNDYQDNWVAQQLGIRALVKEEGLTLIDLQSFTAQGRGWRDPSHTTDGIHYTEPVRDWLAQEIVTKMKALNAPPKTPPAK